MSRVVALHGFTGGPASFAELARALDGLGGPPSLEIHALALLGHAGCASRARSFVAEVDRLAAEIAPLGPVWLVGYSLGARLGYGLLSRHPALFRGALLVGGHPGLQDEPSREARVAADARWVELLRREGLASFLAQWEAQPLFGSQRELADAAREAQARIRGAHEAEGLARSLEVLGLAQMPDWRAGLARFAAEAPLALVVGEGDAKFRGVLAPLAASLAVPLHVVAGAGHNVVLERPAALATLLGELVRVGAVPKLVSNRMENADGRS